MTFAVLAFLAVVWFYPSGGWTTVALATLSALAGYWLASRFWPWRRCRGLCKGTGKLYSPAGDSWRPCPRCEGSGRKRRLLAGAA